MPALDPGACHSRKPVYIDYCSGGLFFKEALRVCKIIQIHVCDFYTSVYVVRGKWKKV
jgi:hypothetical protein